MNLDQITDSIGLWWQGLPPHVQTPLIQSAGAITAAGLALCGVMLTLRSNRAKHRDDRDVTLKKDAFVKYISAMAHVSEHLLQLGRDTPSPDLGPSNAASASVDLIATQATREAVERATFKFAAASNASKLWRTRLKEKEAAVEEAGNQYLKSKNPEEAKAVLDSAKEDLFTLQHEALTQLGELVTLYQRSISVVIHNFRVELGLKDEHDWFANPRPSTDLESVLPGPDGKPKN